MCGVYNEARVSIIIDIPNAEDEEIDAWVKNFCKRMDMNSVEEYMRIYMKAIDEGRHPGKIGRKSLEMLMKYLKINGYFPGPAGQLSEEERE